MGQQSNAGNKGKKSTKQVDNDDQFENEIVDDFSLIPDERWDLTLTEDATQLIRDSSKDKRRVSNKQACSEQNDVHKLPLRKSKGKEILPLSRGKMKTRSASKTPPKITRSSASNTPIRVTRNSANKTPTRAPKNNASKTPTRVTQSRVAKNKAPSEVILKSTQESTTIARQDVRRKLQVSRAHMKDNMCSQKSSDNPKLSLGNPDGASTKSRMDIETKKALTRP